MVGLPARGKTYISKKLTRYLNWIGVPTKGKAGTGFLGKAGGLVLRNSSRSVLWEMGGRGGYFKDPTGEISAFSRPAAAQVCLHFEDQMML